MNLVAYLSILFVFIGCCSNVVFLELVVKEEPASGHILTLCQFIFIALHGFIFTVDFGRKRNVIPIKDYVILVALFFTVNTTNNMAFGFKISMPLHIIFRSGGLIASLILGMIVLGRRYTFSKYASVIMITLGTIISTLASAEHIPEDKKNESSTDSFTIWLTGIAILTFALFLSARMGIYQECLYTRHGKHPREALFYIHLLSIPGFLISWRSILDHAIRFSNSAPHPILSSIPIFASIPRLWLYIAGNTLTQFICISSVFTLTSECSALTVTLVLTLRKFLSLVFSIIYFNNPFTIHHWLGTILVFGGTLIFTDVVGKLREKESKKTE